MKSLTLFLSALMMWGYSLSAAADPSCEGRFVNPITDVCWQCIFPMSIGSVSVAAGGGPDTVNPASPVQYCPAPPPIFVRIGLAIGYWEPMAMTDVSRSPGCMVNLGGFSINLGKTGMGTAKKDDRQVNGAFYHVHWYANPLLFWLEVLMDSTCLENGVFDLTYLTELDPLWADSEMTFIINPDVALFSNPIAQAACAADCVAATAGFPLDLMSWCGGCQGSLFPLSGFVGSKIGGVQSSVLLMMRFTSKLHREALMWSGSGSNGLCGYYPVLEFPKSNYKYNMTYPIPQTQKENGKCCQPFGRTTAVWGAGKEFPYQGEDFAYQIWRKRDCCTGRLPGVPGAP